MSKPNMDYIPFRIQYRNYAKVYLFPKTDIFVFQIALLIYLQS